MPEILVLQQLDWRRDRIRAAVRLEEVSGARHEVLFVQDWTGLRAAARARLAGLASVDPYCADRFQRAPIAAFLDRFPDIALVAYGAFSQRPAADIVELTRLGVSAVVTAGVDDQPARLQRVLLEQVNPAVLETLVTAISSTANSPTATLLRAVVELTLSPLSPDDLARHLGCERRQLERRLKRAKLPPPERLIMKFRVLHAVQLLEAGGRTTENVAHILGFPGSAALDHAIRRHLGLAPHDVRGRAGATREAVINLLAAWTDPGLA